MHLQNSVHGAPNFLQVTGSVMIHLLGSNTKSTEFQPNFTGFKLDSGTNIGFEKLK